MKKFGGEVLVWFVSYLSDRTHSLRVDDSLSAPIDVTSGIIQGFILEPILFDIFVASQLRIITIAST